MNNILFAFNTVAPIFAIVLIGAILRRLGVVNDDYVKRSSAIVFTITLPALIVAEMLGNDIPGGQLGKPLAIFVVWTLICVAACWLLAPLLTSRPPSRGAFVQGSFRGNIAILGLPLIANVVGEGHLGKAMVYLAVGMPLYNILAVIVLAVTAHEAGRIKPLRMAASIVRNPLIIAVLLACALAGLDITLPTFASRTISYLAQLTFPLALLGIGASLTGGMVTRTGIPAVAATVVKTVLLPLCATGTACLLGVRGETLAILFVCSGCPTAVSSFIMAKAMHSDGELAAGIVFLSTIASMGTLGAGIYLLRLAGMI